MQFESLFPDPDFLVEMNNTIASPSRRYWMLMEGLQASGIKIIYFNLFQLTFPLLQESCMSVMLVVKSIQRHWRIFKAIFPLA